MKKTILALACAVLLVAASVMGTLAYLTAKTNEVVNTFTLGKVKFGSTVGDGLDEAKVDEYGNPLKKGTNGNYTKADKVEDAERVTSNTYKLKPAHTYTKDPTIHVDSDSEACYLFVKVENGISSIEDSTKSIASQMETLGWKAVTGYDNIYAYYGSKTATALSSVAASTNVKVFETFTIAGTTSNENLKKYESANIKVTAYGVQSEGWSTTDTAAAIWAATFATPADPAE